MATLQQFQKNLEKLNSRAKLEKILFVAIRKTEKIALSLQKQQLGEGTDNEGNVTGVYSKATENEYLFGKGPKPRKPKVAGEPYNYEATGKFIDNIYLVYGNGEVSFFSKDSKTALLVEKYGNIFGLDDYNLSNYITNSLYPIIMLEIRAVLQL